MIAIMQLVHAVTLNFVLYDSEFSRNHKLNLTLEGEGVQLEGSADEFGLVKFTSDKLVEGQTYTIKHASDMFGDDEINITATPSRVQPLVLTPHMPIRVALVAQNGGHNINDSEVDVYCGDTKAGTSPTNAEGFAFFFIPKQLAFNQCSNNTIQNYGLLPRNPNRIFQEKLYKADIATMLWLVPDPLFSMRLAFIDVHANDISGLNVSGFVNGTQLFSSISENGTVTFESANTTQLQQGQNVTVVVADPENRFTNQTQVFEIKCDKSQDQTIKMYQPAEEMTIKFTILDADFGKTHPIDMTLYSENAYTYTKSGWDGKAHFSSQFVPGKEYVLYFLTDVFSDAGFKFVAEPNSSHSVFLHPYFPLKVNLETYNWHGSINESSFDLFCNNTKVSSAKFNEVGEAYVFVRQYKQQCASVSHYGIFMRNPNRVFQQKMYEVKADKFVRVRPDPLLSMKLKFVEKMYTQNGRPSSGRTLSNFDVKLYQDEKEFYNSKTDENGEILFETTEFEKFPQNKQIRVETQRDETHYRFSKLFDIRYDWNQDHVFEVLTLQMVDLTFKLCDGETKSHIALYYNNKQGLQQDGSCVIKMSRNESYFLLGEEFMVKVVMEGQREVSQKFVIEPRTFVEVKWGLTTGGIVGVSIGAVIGVAILVVAVLFVVIACLKKKNKKNMLDNQPLLEE